MYMCEHIDPPHACAVMPWGGGGYCTLSLAWEGAVMMPLQADLFNFYAVFLSLGLHVLFLNDPTPFPYVGIFLLKIKKEMTRYFILFYSVEER